MQFVKCRLCKKTFQSIGTQYCPECLKDLDEKYKPVRDFLYDHPNASIEEVSEGTEVPERIILYYLKEGRLSMTNASGLLRCEQCGAAVSSGRFCERCRAKLEQRMVQPMQRRMEDQQKRQRDLESINTRSKMYTSRDQQ